MQITEQIEEYIAGQKELKQSDLRALHELILGLMPGCRLWFTDGLNSEGKVVSNPNIGYGFYTMGYADGSSREFYRIGLSGNTAGISVYVLGLEDKNLLRETYGAKIGKASVTGYCIKFKAVKDIRLDVLSEAILFGASLG